MEVLVAAVVVVVVEAVPLAVAVAGSLGVEMKSVWSFFHDTFCGVWPVGT